MPVDYPEVGWQGEAADVGRLNSGAEPGTQLDLEAPLGDRHNGAYAIGRIRLAHSAAIKT